MDSTRTCSFSPCGRPSKAHGLCNGHNEQRRKSQPLTALMSRVPRTLTPGERIAHHSAPDPSTGCRVWTGGTSDYPTITIRGTVHAAHVIAYELEHGPVPAGMTVDHRCRNTRCVNATHLQAVTSKENNENRSSVGRGTSGRRGVYLHRASGLWQVQVTHNRVKHSGGYFHTVEEAADAARELRNRLFTNNLADRRTD